MLASAALFDGVHEADVHLLLERFTHQVLEDAPVFLEGQQSEESKVYVVLRGRVRVSRQLTDTTPVTVAVLGPGDMFGELSAFDPGPHAASAYAVGEVHLAGVTRADLLTWALGRPYIAEQLLRVLARRLRRSRDDTSTLIFVDVAGRVAGVILELAGRLGVRKAGHVTVDHGLTQAQLAELVGASRESVNKTLHDFQARGWIALSGTAIDVLDAGRLRQRARRKTHLRGPR